MLDIGQSNEPDTRCYYSEAILPRTIDDKQPPTKRKPFSDVIAITFAHTIDVLGPEATVDKVHNAIPNAVDGAKYAKVFMTLKELISGDFFNWYIKIGNVSMLSEGTEGTDNTYSLYDGMLRLNVDKASYERAGLAGKAIESPGRRHAKARYLIEINLRLPSMVRGKPGFNRVVYAFDNALIERLTWLFFDHRSPGLPNDSLAKDTSAVDLGDTGVSGGIEHGRAASPSQRTGEGSKVPIYELHPQVSPIAVETQEPGIIRMPPFPSTLGEDDKIEAADWLEWLTLAMLDSPRLRMTDVMDATLSRYSIPDLSSGTVQDKDAHEVGTAAGEDDGAHRSHADGPLCLLSVQGFMPSAFANQLVSKCIKQVDDSLHAWAAFRVSGFGGARCMIFIRQGRAHVWVYK